MEEHAQRQAELARAAGGEGRLRERGQTPEPLRIVRETRVIRSAHHNPDDILSGDRRWRSVLIENPGERDLHVGFGPGQGDQSQADTRVLAGNWRMIPQEFSIVSVGADDQASYPVQYNIVRFNRLMPAASGIY